MQRAEEALICIRDLVEDESTHVGIGSAEKLTDQPPSVRRSGITRRPSALGHARVAENLSATRAPCR